MKLSVIIVNYNVKYFLEQCLQTVVAASHNLPVEILIVDNNSKDGSIELIREKFPQIKLIANENNVGFSKANNQAIKLSKGEYVLLLNPDTVVQNDTFKKVIDFMDATPDAGGLGVKMIDGKGEFLPESKRGLPTPAVAFFKIFGLAALFPKSRLFGQYHLGYLDDKEIHEVDILSGAFMLMRKSALDKVGLLDETFFMYGEDIDLSYRILKGGYKNYYYPKTKIIHYKGESTKKTSINYVFVFYRAMVIFASKHFSKQHAKLFSALINIAVWGRAGIAVVAQFFRNMFLPVTDSVLLLSGLVGLKIWYADYANIIFEDWLVFSGFGLSIVSWLTSIFLSGGYDRPFSIYKALKGWFIGAVMIFLLYALLPEEFRFSRALTILGTGWAFLSFLLVRLLLFSFGFKKVVLFNKQKKRFAIVGDEAEANRVEGLLYQMIDHPDYVAKVSPLEENPENNSFFVSHLSKLKELVGIFKIDEVVFCLKNIRPEDIINQMVLLQTDVEYKIAPSSVPFVIGSNSIHTSGDVYLLDLQAINKPENRRIKRLFDIAATLVILLIFPVLSIAIKSFSGLLINCFYVLFGKKTWVSYDDNVGLKGLPIIKKGVLSLSDTIDSKEDSVIQNVHLKYAKNYTTAKDLKVMLQAYPLLGKSAKNR